MSKSMEPKENTGKLMSIKKVTPESMKNPNVQPFDMTAFDEDPSLGHIRLLHLRRLSYRETMGCGLPGNCFKWLYVVLGLA